MAQSILLEGIDGTGKSTQVALLKGYFRQQNIEALFLREPGGSEYYEAIREHIHFKEYERSPLSDALACAAGIAQNIVLTKAALAQGTWVVSDRSYISNAVYQISQDLDLETARQINDIALQGFTYDIKILFDIPVEAAEQRLIAIGKKKDHWESKGRSYFKKVRELYLEMAQEENMTVIDATQTAETIHAQIVQIIQQ